MLTSPLCPIMATSLKVSDPSRYPSSLGDLVRAALGMDPSSSQEAQLDPGELPEETFFQLSQPVNVSQSLWESRLYARYWEQSRKQSKCQEQTLNKSDAY